MLYLDLVYKLSKLSLFFVYENHTHILLQAVTFSNANQRKLTAIRQAFILRNKY